MRAGARAPRNCGGRGGVNSAAFEIGIARKPLRGKLAWTVRVAFPACHPLPFEGHRRRSRAAASCFMEENIEVEGRITAVLPGTMFRVQLDNAHEVLAVISGKMRKRWIRLSTGDRVKMEMSPYDMNKARIVWRVG